MKRTYLGLAAVIIALGLYLVYDFRSEDREKSSKEAAGVLFPYKADQVNEIIIEKDGKTTRLSRSIDGWRLEEPIKDWAENAFTDDFVETLTKDRALEVAKEGSDIDWKVYGLDQPAGKVTLKTQKGDSKTLEVSGKTNFEKNSVGRISGDQRVLILPSSWPTHITRGANDFRDKRLFRGKIGAVEGIHLKNVSGSVDLTMTDGVWDIQEKTFLVDQNSVRDFLTQTSGIRAEEVASEQAPTASDRAKYGLDKPIASVSFSTKEKVWSAAFSKGSDGKFYALISDPVFVLRFGEVDLQRPLHAVKDDFRDKKVPFSFDKNLVRKIEIVNPLKKTSLVQEKGVWRIADWEDKTQVDQAKVNEFLDHLRGSSATRQLETSAISLGFKPNHRIRLFDDKNILLLEVAWMPQGKTALMNTSKWLSLLSVDSDVIDQWPMGELLKGPIKFEGTPEKAAQ